jgi:hypothetical protein
MTMERTLSDLYIPCRYTFEAGDKVGVLSCHHMFHCNGNSENCRNHIDKWLRVSVLDRQTYQGGTRGSRLCGEGRDRETKNSKVCARTQDTRFIQVQAAKVASPTSYLGIKYGALRLVLVEIRCPTRCPALLYIVQGAGS